MPEISSKRPYYQVASRLDDEGYADPNGADREGYAPDKGWRQGGYYQFEKAVDLNGAKRNELSYANPTPTVEKPEPMVDVKPQIYQSEPAVVIKRSRRDVRDMLRKRGINPYSVSAAQRRNIRNLWNSGVQWSTPQSEPDTLPSHKNGARLVKRWNY